MNSLRITVLPDKTFRGVIHFQECDYDASTSLAFHAVESGLAKWSDKGEVSRIADKFAEVLRDWLTLAEFAEMKALNETAEYQGNICASHNYYDANMAMHEAWVSEFGGDGIDADDEDQAKTWGAAWDLARQRHIGHKP